MIFGTHLALDNSDHVLDGGPNPPTEGGTSPRADVNKVVLTALVRSAILGSSGALVAHTLVSFWRICRQPSG